MKKARFNMYCIVVDKKKYLINILLVSIFAVLCILCITPSSWADESNREEVRRNLEGNGWRVIWGKNFTEKEWYEGTKAIAESIALESPAPFLKWFGDLMEENLVMIQNNMNNVGREEINRWIVQSLNSKRIITYQNLEIQAGFATYDRWDKLIYDEPRTYQCKQDLPFGAGWTWGVCTTTERVEKTINLPNWHQFYIRYKLIGRPRGGGGGGNGGGGNTGNPLTWTIKNATGQQIWYRFYWPDWRHDDTHSLYNGQKWTFNIQCKKGENICYGAWSQDGRVWGVGKGDRGCAKCCFTCGSGKVSKKLIP
ncbi:MAG: hypothetical protein HQL06_07420 [Nitrospirae bacterium]|nr:hypothetical protein [Nitrospirota bacterium]